MRQFIRRAGIAGLVLGAFVVAMPGAAAVAQTSSQFWPEVDLHWTAAPHWRLFALGRLQTQPDENRATLGIHVDYVGARYATVRVGYRYIFPPSGGTHENRGVAEVTLRGSGLGVTLLNRVRLDVRDTDTEVSTRFRERVWLERRIGSATRLHLTPFVSAEVYYDSRFSELSRIRYLAGAEIASSSPVSVQAAYVRQNEWQGSGGDVNAFAVKAIFSY